MTIALIILVLACLVSFYIIKRVWHSPLFWVVAFALTIAFLPITAGMSPIALASLIVLRLVLLSRLFNSGNRRPA